MTQAIRLSPSGPVITGAGGAPLVPGSGMQLRLVQAQATVSASTLIPTVPVAIGPVLGVSTIALTLPLPNPGANYKATVLCDLFNVTTVTGVVQMYLDTSDDGGSTWVQAASNSHNVAGGGNARNGARQARLDLIMTAGAALGVTSAPQTPSLKVRARIGANLAATVGLSSDVTDGGDNGVGTILLELAELL